MLAPTARYEDALIGVFKTADVSGTVDRVATERMCVMVLSDLYTMLGILGVRMETSLCVQALV